MPHTLGSTNTIFSILRELGLPPHGNTVSWLKLYSSERLRITSFTFRIGSIGSAVLQSHSRNTPTSICPRFFLPNDNQVGTGCTQVQVNQRVASTLMKRGLLDNHWWSPLICSEQTVAPTGLSWFTGKSPICEVTIFPNNRQWISGVRYDQNDNCPKFQSASTQLK